MNMIDIYNEYWNVQNSDEYGIIFPQIQLKKTSKDSICKSLIRSCKGYKEFISTSTIYDKQAGFNGGITSANQLTA